MIKKSLLIFSLVVLLISVVAVYSITLTRESTDLVRIPVAIRAEVCLWDESLNSCLGENKEVVFGHADVYPIRDPPLSETALMELFIFDNMVYRSTTLGVIPYANYYTQEQREQFAGDLPPEADNIVGVRGDLSRVNPDGTEEQGPTVTREEEGKEGQYTESAWQYKITYRNLGVEEFGDLNIDDYEDMELRIGDDVYKLQSIVASAEDIEWRPR